MAVAFRLMAGSAHFPLTNYDGIGVGVIEQERIEPRLGRSVLVVPVDANLNCTVRLPQVPASTLQELDAIGLALAAGKPNGHVEGIAGGSVACVVVGHAPDRDTVRRAVGQALTFVAQQPPGMAAVPKVTVVVAPLGAFASAALYADMVEGLREFTAQARRRSATADLPFHRVLLGARGVDVAAMQRIVTAAAPAGSPPPPPPRR